MKEVLGTFAAALVFAAYAPYLRDILRNKTRPHPYSWFVWGLNTSLIFALQVSHGAGAGSYTTATVALMSFVVFGLSFRQHTGDVTKTDTAFLVTALLAMVLWALAKQPNLSISLLILIDLLAIGPSIRKAWGKPEEETLSQWSINGLRHALALFALQKYSFITLLNPAVWITADWSFSLMLIVRRRAKPLRQKRHI